MKNKSKLSKNNVFLYIWNLPRKQLTWDKQRSKICILILLILLFVIPATIIWIIVFKRCSWTNGIWDATEKFRCNLFLIITSRNDIIEYPIWQSFSKLTVHWLTYLQVGVAVGGLLVLVLLWFFVDNNVLFAFLMTFYLGTMFNGIDAVVDGKAVDYFSFTNKFKWLEVILIWPTYVTSQQFSWTQTVAFNLPDLAMSIGIQGTIVFIVVWTIKKIVKSAKDHKINKQINQKKLNI